MADTKPKFTLHPFKPESKPGHYDDEVQALIEAGPGIAITIQIPKPDDEDKAKKEIAKHVNWFRESARKFDRSGRLVDTVDQEDGSVHLDFVLRDAIKRPRKAQAETAEPEVSDTPVAEDAA